MNAVQLILPNGIESGVWMCGKCRVLAASCHSPVMIGNRPTTDDEKGEHARRKAERCCEWPCEKCGKPGRPHWTLCDACDREKAVADSAAREKARFDKAQKLTVAEWDGSDWLYDDRSDKWFRDLDELEDWLSDDEERTRPEYLWCSTPVTWRPDVAGYIADAMHDHYAEEACDNITSEDYKPLEEFVSRWWAEQGVVSFDVDYSRCVLLPPKEAA